jgi:hypothetical protein
MTLRRLFAAALGVLAGMVLALTASAQSGSSYGASPGIGETFRADFGGFFQSFTTNIFLESSSGASTSISLEDMFGENPHKTTFRVDAYWNFSRHSGLRFSYLGYARSSSATLAQNVQWGDYVINAGSGVDSKLRVAVPQLYYSYSAVGNATMELGAMLGFSTYVNKLSLDASGSITTPGGTAEASFSSDQWHITVPVPATGAYLLYSLYPGILIDADVKWLPNITISGYTGGMLDYKAGMDFFFTKNVGVGAVYQYTHIHVYHVETNTVGFDWKYSGPYVYVSLAF